MGIPLGIPVFGDGLIYGRYLRERRQRIQARWDARRERRELARLIGAGAKSSAGSQSKGGRL